MVTVVMTWQWLFSFPAGKEKDWLATSLPLHVQEVRRVQAWELGNDDGDDDDDDDGDDDDGGIPDDGSGVADNCHVDKWEWNCRSG